jgi:hypothetical protein
MHGDTTKTWARNFLLNFIYTALVLMKRSTQYYSYCTGTVEMVYAILITLVLFNKREVINSKYNIDL